MLVLDHAGRRFDRPFRRLEKDGFQMVPLETVDFDEPRGGWGYVYDPQPEDTPETMLKYDPVLWSFEPGCLDGRWTRFEGADRWDGTAPGDVRRAKNPPQKGR